MRGKTPVVPVLAAYLPKGTPDARSPQHQADRKIVLRAASGSDTLFIFLRPGHTARAAGNADIPAADGALPPEKTPDEITCAAHVILPLRI